jgi:hypothetical protein
VESIGGGKNAFIGNHGTTWVPVDWNVSTDKQYYVMSYVFVLHDTCCLQTWQNYNVEGVPRGKEYV